jgi:hypothetical protein
MKNAGGRGGLIVFKMVWDKGESEDIGQDPATLGYINLQDIAGLLNSGYPPIMFKKSSSFKIWTPSSLAALAFEPASSPTTT